MSRAVYLSLILVSQAILIPQLVWIAVLALGRILKTVSISDLVLIVNAGIGLSDPTATPGAVAAMTTPVTATAATPAAVAPLPGHKRGSNPTAMLQILLSTCRRMGRGHTLQQDTKYQHSRKISKRFHACSPPYFSSQSTV